MFVDAGWQMDFSQPPESGDPLVGVSLCGNAVLLGIAEGYVTAEQRPYAGSGVVLYMTVPAVMMQQIYQRHLIMNPTPLTKQPWGDMAFEVAVGGYRFMIAEERNG